MAAATDAEPGDRCPTIGCDGRLELISAGDCSCHIRPPCAACTDAKLTCDACGFELEPT